MNDARGGLRLGLEAAAVFAVTALLARVSWSAATRVAAPGVGLVEFAEQVERLVGLAVTGAGTLAGVWLGAWYAVCTTCVLLAATGRRWRRLERLVLERGPRLARRALAGALGVGLALGATGAAAAAQPMPAGAAAAADAATQPVALVKARGHAAQPVPVAAMVDRAPRPFTAGAVTAPALAARPLPADVGDPLDLGWSSSSTPSHGASQGTGPQSPAGEPGARPAAPMSPQEHRAEEQRMEKRRVVVPPAAISPSEPPAPGPSATGSGATGTPTAPAAPESTPAEPTPAGSTTTEPRSEPRTAPPTASTSPLATTAPASPPAATAPSSPPATTATSPAPPSMAPAAEPTEPSDATEQDRTDTSDQASDDRVTVQPGDSLWSIAARHRPGATTAQTAVDWPVWYRLNADVIGDDPHLIHPGQQLRVPRLTT